MTGELQVSNGAGCQPTMADELLVLARELGQR